MNIINTTLPPNFLTPKPVVPLFLRTVAPDEDGQAAVYRLTLLHAPKVYGVHWLAPSGGAGAAERRLCAEDGCPWCATGSVSHEMYAGLAIDHDHNRFVILQMSRAAAEPVAQAATEYALGGSSRPVMAFGLLDSRQPLITLRARRSPKGPRYSAKVEPRDFTTDPATGRRLGLAAWFKTDPGLAWLQDALVNTAPVLRPYALKPEALDVMPLIWPSEYGDDDDAEDADE